jgi:hypothetical protein
MNSSEGRKKMSVCATQQKKYNMHYTIQRSTTQRQIFLGVTSVMVMDIDSTASWERWVKKKIS